MAEVECVCRGIEEDGGEEGCEACGGVEEERADFGRD